MPLPVCAAGSAHYGAENGVQHRDTTRQDAARHQTNLVKGVRAHHMVEVMPCGEQRADDLFDVLSAYGFCGFVSDDIAAIPF